VARHNSDVLGGSNSGKNFGHFSGRRLRQSDGSLQEPIRSELIGAHVFFGRKSAVCVDVAFKVM
jgi:hypothetical protein